MVDRLKTLWIPGHGRRSHSCASAPKKNIFEKNGNKVNGYTNFDNEVSREVRLDLPALYMTSNPETRGGMNLNILPQQLQDLIKVVSSGKPYNGVYKELINRLPAWVKVPAFDRTFTDKRKRVKNVTSDRIFINKRGRLSNIAKYDPPSSTGVRYVGEQIPWSIKKLCSDFKAGLSVNELNEESKKGLYSLMNAVVERVYDKKHGSYGACKDAAAYTSIFVYNAGQEDLEITIGSNIDPHAFVYKNPLYRRCSELEAREAASQPNKSPDFIFLMRRPNGEKKYTPEQLTPCKICALRVVNDDFINRGGRIFFISDKKEILDHASREGFYVDDEVVPVNSLSIGESKPIHYTEIPNGKIRSLKMEGVLGATAFDTEAGGNLLSFGEFLNGYAQWGDRLFMNGNIERF